MSALKKVLHFEYNKKTSPARGLSCGNFAEQE